VASRGVDAVGSGFEDPAAIVRALARKKRKWSGLVYVFQHRADTSPSLRLHHRHDRQARLH
jgi:hypothetical protein